MEENSSYSETVYMMYSMEIYIPQLSKENIHTKFPKCYFCLWIEASFSSYYKSKKVRKYFEENKDANPNISFNCITTEHMVMEEIWNIAKQDLFVLQYYQSFADLKNKISIYFRTKRFNLDMRNYLLRDVR